VLKSKYLYFAALNYELAGKKDNAKNIYQSVVELSENSEFGNKSKVRLSMLGTKID
jgi:tRNA threonylcarbamoyladenosine modification (KEOPS) complex  Pcc1 subunit